MSGGDLSVWLSVFEGGGLKSFELEKVGLK
jgi:hypothetical protein